MNKQMVADAKRVISQFKRPKTDEEIFYHTCFCICAPQAKFSQNKIVVAELMQRDFFNKTVRIDALRKIVKKVRFQRKADYLKLAKQVFPQILQIVKGDESDQDKRKAIKELVKGIGMKEASHLLRNCGSEDLAIIDSHILKFLKEDQPKSDKEYLKIERSFKDMADKEDITMAVLDAVIWAERSKTDWSSYDY